MADPGRYDVAVIGYGPTGVTAANLLGAAGLSVVVLERDASVYARARAISTDEEVLRIWQQTGLAEELKRDMLGDRPLDFVDDRGRPFISFSPAPRGHGHPAQMFLYQPALEAALRSGVARYPHVDVRLAHEVLRVRPQSDQVELLVAQSEDKIARVRASYVIAADGGSSPTRGLLGVGFDGRTYEDRWVVIDTEMREPWPDHDRLRFRCDPDRPAVDCPTPLGHHRWEFPVLPGEDEAELVSAAAVWRLLNRYGVTDRQVEILRATVYSHHVRVAARWRIGRVFLAGDAAHVMPPWAGQGMAAGVRDVANLCWKLAAVVTGALPESVLDSYEAERKPHLRAITRRAVFAGRVITERRPLVTALRNPAFRLLRQIRPLNRILQTLAWIPDCHYRSGFLSEVRSPAVGRKFPQPWVLADGAKTRLDDVLGDGWALLHLPGVVADPAWVAAGAKSLVVGAQPDSIVDINGELTAWLRAYRAAAVVLRPDRIVYAAAPADRALPAPPMTASITAERTSS